MSSAVKFIMQERLTPPLDNGRITSEFFAGITGGILGSIGFAYAGAVIIGPHGGEDPGLIGAVIGTGLINFRNGQLNLAAPTIYLHRQPSTGRLVQTVDLVRLSF